MKTHELKTLTNPFNAICRNDKKAEFRFNDRDFKVGDRLYLREWIPDGGTERGGYFTGDSRMRRITHIQTGFGIPDGYAMLSMENI